jgi:hypothetical protein
VKALALESASARSVIQQDMKEERAAIRQLVDERVNAVQGNLDELEREQKNQDAALKAQKNVRVQAIAFAILGTILSIVASIISTGLAKGLFPS